MIVTIIKGRRWYSNKVGETFYVEEKNNYFSVKSNDYPGLKIKKNDCAILVENEEFFNCFKDTKNEDGEKGNVDTCISEKSKLGIKYDSEKPQLGLISGKAINELGKVLTFGAKKYGKDNWRDLEDLQFRCLSAALRHLMEVVDGNLIDEETGLSHFAHAMCNMMFAIDGGNNK